MFRLIAILILSGASLLMPGAAMAGPLNVSLVIIDNSPPYRQFAESFNKALAANNADVTIAESQGAGEIHADLIVAVGMKATELAIARAGAPVLAVMVPDAGFQELLARTARQQPARSISAIYLNQPLGRQIDFLQAAIPERRRIGLLYSPSTHIDIEGMRQLVDKRGASLVALPVRSEETLFSSLERVLSSSDVLLVTPDSAIYNSSNIRNILLTSYRHHVPLVGLSLSYVNAGALCALFSTAEQLADQAGATVISYARNRRLPAPKFPADFTVAVNQQVARSLGIELPSRDAIHKRMNKARMEITMRRD